VKVKVTFTLKHGMNAQRGNRIIVYSFFIFDARWRWVVNATLRPPYALSGIHFKLHKIISSKYFAKPIACAVILV